MNKIIKDRRGFSLIEVIISIAVLSILCVVFLQLFIKARDISDQSYVLDESVRIVNSYIEEIKGSDSMQSIKKMNSLAWMASSVSDAGITFEGFFDERFHSGVADSGNYNLTITITSVEGNNLESQLNNSEYAQLYNVQVQMTDEIETHKVIYKTNALIILDK